MRNYLTPIRGKGFTLAELMIALVAGLVVSSAVIAFFLSGMRSSGQYVQSTRLTQEIRNSMNLLTRELRRAGHDRNSMAFLAQTNTSPFAPMVIDTANQCVIFAYDKAGSGPGALNDGEVHAIRRIQTNYNDKSVGVIEFAESAGGVKPTCTDATASYTTFPPTCAGLWCAMSDPAVLNITQLTFTDNRTTIGTAPTQAQVRDIGIDLRGQLTASTEFTRGMKASVRVRADCTIQTSCNVSP